MLISQDLGRACRTHICGMVPFNRFAASCKVLRLPREPSAPQDGGMVPAEADRLAYRILQFMARGAGDARVSIQSSGNTEPPFLACGPSMQVAS